MVVTAKSGSENATNELKEELASLREDISRIAETLQRLSGEQVADGRERVRQAVGTVEDGIQHYPLTSLAAAFGVGFIIGKMLDR